MTFDARNRTMPGVNQVSTWMRQAYVRSIQRATITINGATSGTATVNTVNTNNAILRWLSWTDNDVGGTAANVLMALVLTNSTTVTATVNTAAGSDHIVSFELIEYWPGIVKSMQRGTISCVTATSATATITAVDPNRAELIFCGYTTTDTTAIVANVVGANLVLTNATTITLTKPTGNGTMTAPFQIVEWF